MRAITSLAASLLLVFGAVACSKNTVTSPSTTTTTTATSPSTMTFASQLALRGSTSRTFTMASAGAVKVTLLTLGNGTVKAGLGIGVPTTGAPCSLAQSVVTVSGSAPQITTTADAGTYCVQLFDTGGLTEDTPFSLTVEHP